MCLLVQRTEKLTFSSQQLQKLHHFAISPDLQSFPLSTQAAASARNLFKTSPLVHQKLKMSNPKRDCSIADADIRLLETGNLADATIVCGDRTWNVHRVILTPRCQWFKTAFLNNNFEVSKVFISLGVLSNLTAGG